MVPFAVSRGCGAVGMGCKVVEFDNPFVGTGGHLFLLAAWMLRQRTQDEF